jgi:hypothetical protein
MELIKYNDIHRIISEYDLKLFKEIWHYSFNPGINKNDFVLVKTESGIFLYQPAFDQWSPVCCYTNSASSSLQVLNFLTTPLLKTESPLKAYWYLDKPEISFFLKRRDAISNQPRKHFPTSATYNQFKKKIQKSFFYEPLNPDFFTLTYNKLKKPNYLDGGKIISLLSTHNIPEIWLKTGVLKDNDQTVAIALLIDDGRSVSLFNITGIESNFSYGLILCTEIIDYCGKNNYFSFDSGVSGIYGSYKQKIFLDSYKVCLNEKEKEYRNSFFTLLKKIIKPHHA